MYRFLFIKERTRKAGYRSAIKRISVIHHHGRLHLLDHCHQRTVGGRPELSDETRLRLAVRGWCFPTVEGACARIELLLGETALRLTSVTIDPSEVRERTRELIDGRMTLELASDESLIVLETPLVLAAADADDGPVALPPPSRASLLLHGAPFAERALVLVIEPSFADILPQASQRLPAPSP